MDSSPGRPLQVLPELPGVLHSLPLCAQEPAAEHQELRLTLQRETRCDPSFSRGNQTRGPGSDLSPQVLWVSRRPQHLRGGDAGLGIRTRLVSLPHDSTLKRGGESCSFAQSDIIIMVWRLGSWTSVL